MIPTTLPIQLYLMPAAFGLPLALGIGLAIKRWRPSILRLAPWSALPALAAVIWVSSGEIVSIPWILLEMRLAVDPTGRLFLLFTSLLWLLSGIYAQSYLASDPRRGRFFFFFLLSMAGNFGLIVSQDAVSFYVFFALMSFASYGLVVHNGDSDALQAGRIYIYLVVIGEILLVTALLLQAWTVDSLLLKDFSNARPKTVIMALVLIGFGIKAGALPVHVWLPLAHPAAPTPASRPSPVTTPSANVSVPAMPAVAAAPARDVEPAPMSSRSLVASARSGTFEGGRRSTRVGEAQARPPLEVLVSRAGTWAAPVSGLRSRPDPRAPRLAD